MIRRTDVAIRILTLLVLWGSPWLSFAQTPKPPSLKEQIEAQYPPATVLAIQKQGILGVALTSSKTCAAKYQDGNLKPPDVSCAAPLKVSSRLLTVGEKVHPSEIQVNLAREQISFWIVECDSCNKGIPSSSYKAQIEFQFAKAFLEKGSVSEIEDTIGQVLSIDESADQPAQPAESPSEVLTNSDVIKMAKANLGDGIIISKIKSSAYNFDTSVDGMVKLKEAGVSNHVIQAMHDAQEAAKAAANEPGPTSSTEPQQNQGKDTASVPGQVRFSVRHRHISFFSHQENQEAEYYCSGTLSLSPDGTVAYDCAQTDDPSGRCDHVSFAPGSLKEVKIGFAGNLHLVSKTQGKFDFYGNRNDINQAQAAIAALIQK